MTQGYLTFAQNTPGANYLAMAYVQALSIKATQKINSYAVVVDEYTNKFITAKHKSVFDHIIPMPGVDEAANDKWKLRNEWKAGIATPFDETVKIEADMLFTASVDHWWDIMARKDVCFTTNVVSYTGKIATSRAYRKLFDDNHLINLYNGFYYFKKSETADRLFESAKTVYANWPLFRDQILINCRDEHPTTDVVFAIAAKLCGEHSYYDPTSAVPRFAHMKGAMQGWAINEDWQDHLHCQFDQSTVTVGFTRQTVPFHYYQKNFITRDIINHYEQLAHHTG